jgi:hypothetical protein
VGFKFMFQERIHGCSTIPEPISLSFLVRCFLIDSGANATIDVDGVSKIVPGSTMGMSTCMGS